MYFLPEDGKFPYHIGKAEFSTHGEYSEGPDTSTIYSLTGCSKLQNR